MILYCYPLPLAKIQIFPRNFKLFMQRRRIARGRMKNPKRIDEIQILHNHLLIHHQTMMELKKDRALIMMIMTVLATKNQILNNLENIL
jgi:hypothetical protein